MTGIEGIVCMVAMCLSAADMPPRVEGLRCEHRADAPVVDTPQPRFSWRLAPGGRGLAQSAWQVEVTRGGKAVWDSGKVVSDQSSLVPYAGEPLSSGNECRWRVRVWDQQDRASAWSEAASFHVGPMTPDDWSGDWIGVDWMQNNEGPLPLLRKEVDLPGSPKCATAYVCALGYYELYVNGERVGDAVLSPAVSDYSKRGLYLAHDLTPHLKAGNNTIGIWLGRGWSTAMLARATTAGPVVRAQVRIIGGDGTVTTVATDNTWKAHPSHITPLGKGSSGDYGGEEVDAASEIPNWSRPEYDDAAWRGATVHRPPTPIIAAQPVEPNRLLDTITPVSVEPLDNGHLVDMGRNYTGWLELRLPDELAAGAQVEMEYADKRFPDGTFQTYRQRDVYRARGGGGEHFCNRFNYHAFRWMLVRGLPRAPRLDEIQGRLISTDYEAASAFESDHPLLNEIYRTVLWTHRSLSLGGYTVDCPHRERLGYGGDSGTSMEGAMINFRSAPFYTKWAADWRDAQAEDGDVPYTAPHAQDAGGGPVWSGFCITMPWQMYVTYGDRRILEQGWPVMKKWLAFIETKMRDGLLQPYVGIGCAGAQWSFLGDWVPPGRKQGKDRVDDRSTLFFNNGYLVHCLQLASRIGALVGDDAAAARYAGQADVLAAHLHEAFLNEDGATYANGEQTYLAMPLLFGITPPSQVGRVMDALERDIVYTRQGHLNTGMHGTYYMTRHLIASRRNDLLTLMMTRETYPSYGYMLRNGATTIWEEWDGDNSHIHNTMISIGMWFIAGLGGIQADEARPGYKHFRLAPGIESGLGKVAVSCETEYGRIVSAWKRDGDTVQLYAEVPPNSTATVILPAAEANTVTESGGAPEDQPGVSNIRYENGLFHCDIVSGAYTFVTHL